jgi:hypothetical protein
MAGRLPPDDPGRDGPGAVADHHDRVLPAGPGPCHGDRAGPHAARLRRGYGYAVQSDRTTSRLAVRVLVPGGLGRGRPGRTGTDPRGRTRTVPGQDHNTTTDLARGLPDHRWTRPAWSPGGWRNGEVALTTGVAQRRAQGLPTRP